MAAQRTPGDEPSETERLLAEVEGMLGDQPRRSLQPHGDAQPARRPFRRRVRAAASRVLSAASASGCCS